MSTVAGKARAFLNWIPGDSLGATRIYRNGIILTRIAVGVTELTDDGLSPGNLYTYKTQMIRNGQTSEFEGGFTPDVITDTPQLDSPTWQIGYPRGAGYQFPFEDPPSPGRCDIRCDNPDPAAFTIVWMTAADAEFGGYNPVGSIPPGGHTLILNAEDMPGTDPTDEFRWFHLTSQRTGYVDSDPSSNERASFGNML
jgi:hypothetical protein